MWFYTWPGYEKNADSNETRTKITKIIIFILHANILLHDFFMNVLLAQS